MTYLLDVNALIALGVIDHTFHGRLVAWIQGTKAKVATCSITELGFVRVLAQAYGFTIGQARATLKGMKDASADQITFLADDHDASHLPSWVRAPKQITDGHLSRLAHAHGAVLATLDASIPGSYVIPT